jgi:hypothetical protein
MSALFSTGFSEAQRNLIPVSGKVDVVNRYLDNLDSQDPEKVQVALGLCDSEASILDEFPPHEWHGRTACADWWKGFLAYNDKSGITPDGGALGMPQTIDVNGDHAYFVAPLTIRISNMANRSRRRHLSR